MRDRILVIVPTRGRPINAARLAREHQKRSGGRAELLFVVDRDDPELPTYAGQPLVPGVIDRRVQDPRRLGPTLNEVALAKADGYAAIGFMGDDHLPVTQGWDRLVWDALHAAMQADRPVVAYGDDLLQGAKLPTAAFLPSRLVKALGFLSPPPLVHLYIDNFWLELGRETDCLRYLPRVVIEHLHPAAGKARWDAGYERANDRLRDEADRIAWEAFRDGGEFMAAVARVRKEYGLDA